MNKKGFVLLFSLMMVVVFFLLGLALAPALKGVTGEAMDSPLLNCSTTTNDQIKIACDSIDMQQLFIGVIFGMAGLLLARSL